MKKFLILAVIIIVAGLGAWRFIGQSGDLSDAGHSPVKSNVPTVDFAAVQDKAENGDAQAQYELGRLYTRRSAGHLDYKQAVHWLQVSAEKGNRDALALLGELTAAGQGAAKDDKAAVGYYQKAAELGSVAGQYDLAFCYARGIGAQQNDKLAARWYLAAAEGGDPLSQYDLGQRYELGLGVQADLIEAFKWFKLASAQGQDDAVKALATLKSKLTRDQIAEGAKRVDSFAVRK